MTSNLGIHQQLQREGEKSMSNLRFASIAFFCFLCVSVCLGQKPVSANGYAVVVHPTIATFKFPVPPRPIWQWGAGGLQYTWHAKLQTPRGRYEVGFFLFGPMGEMPPESGDIRKLLANGQFSAFDGSRSVDPEVRVTGSYAGGFLTITVTGAPSVKRLFGQHPTSCDLFSQDPHQRALSNVPIQYVSK